MIVISAGMQKSGTVWYYNLTNDLLTAAGFDDGRVIRESYGLQDLIGQRNGEVGVITPTILEQLQVPCREGHSYVIKTHKRPTAKLQELLRSGGLKAAYIYRDPRAVALSAFEHGKYMRAQGILRPFGWILSLELGMLYARMLTSVWRYWRQVDRETGKVLMCRYEDLVADTVGETGRLAEYLSLQAAPKDITRIVERYSRVSLRSDRQLRGALHYVHGKPERFRQIFSRWQMRFANLVLGKRLEEMGYSR